MGLAAGQARLLTITARKSDCEYQSMRLSHQKIALSRELSDLSNEYQNSLNQTKLIYDYYGTGDTSNPLSYGILMNPSALNDYMPTVLTDSMGRVTLNEKYAAAARFAGIPQEGLGTLPSETMRQAFVEGLYNSGLITETLKNTIQGLPYNQAAGFGGDATVAIQTQDVTIDELIDLLENVPVDMSELLSHTSGDDPNQRYSCEIRDMVNGDSSDDYNDFYSDIGKIVDADGDVKPSLSMGDLLSGSYSLLVLQGSGQSDNFDYSFVEDVLNSPIWTTLKDTMTDLFGYDTYMEKAIDYANSQLSDVLKSDNPSTDSNWAYREEFRHRSTNGIINDFLLSSASRDYLGYTYSRNKGSSYHGAASLNISNVVKAYLTWIQDYINGISVTDAYGNDKYLAERGHIKSSKFVSDDESYIYTINTGTNVSSDDLAQSTFYDTLFNQICANGWTENNRVDDNDYLQEMLQNGMLYFSKVKDDGYYYQGNYATDTYIKEVSDDTYIAQAEAKYNTEKAKLNTKEETLDMKMKNLDTEISSLTTEYDTIKNTISKNIEKSFKRYNA